MTRPFGLYIHVPFCAKLCHYCDFAKTANFQDDHVSAYFKLVALQLNEWLASLPNQKFTSVFFGGGTPGLFVSEYDSLFELFSSRLTPDAEVTLEANPHNVTAAALKSWRAQGFNRISVGVQSFDDAGLRVMTRDHSSREARRSLEAALEIMPHVNGDLIYGWPGQTDASWQQDLESMRDIGVNHLSLYALTFEGNTPFARAERRGAMSAEKDEALADRYDAARAYLQQSGFDHEEISNWSKTGHSCAHNWLYWSGDFYVGVGAGAHGFVPSVEAHGLRYSYPGDLRLFLKNCAEHSKESGIILEEDRTLQSWLMEYVGCGLRTEKGVCLSLIEAKGFKFQADKVVQDAISTGQVIFENGQLKLPPNEWFRETAWSSLLLARFNN